MKDYFQILGLTIKNIEGSDHQRVISRAFRKLAPFYHPDQHPNDPEAEENFKQLNEAYQVFSDEQQLLAYLREISEAKLDFGRIISAESDTAQPQYEQIQDILGNKTFKLPSFGWGMSGMDIRDVLEAFTMYFNGEEMQTIQDWINEKSMAWTFEEPKSGKGIPQLMIRSQMFIPDINNNDEVYRFEIEDYSTGQLSDPIYVPPGEFINIRQYIDGRLVNVEIGKMEPSKLGDVLIAVDLIAHYQTGSEVYTNYQEFARNILKNTAREYEGNVIFNKVTIPKYQRPDETQSGLELPPPRS